MAKQKTPGANLVLHLRKPKTPEAERCLNVDKEFSEVAFWYEYGRELARQDAFRLWLADYELPNTCIFQFLTNSGSWMIGGPGDLVNQLPWCLQELCSRDPRILLKWVETPWVKLCTAGQRYYKSCLPHPRTKRRQPFACLEIPYLQSRSVVPASGKIEYGAAVTHEALLKQVRGYTTSAFWGVCAIDLAADDHEIHKAFSQWLAEEKKKRRKELIHPLDNEHFGKALSALAAYRIRKAHGKERLTYPEMTRLKYEAPFLHNSDFKAGVKRAREMLNEWCRTLCSRTIFSPE